MKRVGAILTVLAVLLGSGAVRGESVHVKPPELKVEGEGWKWTNLYDGQVDWPEVHKAFEEVGYSGWFTAELRGGDADYLRDVAKRMDRIIAGSKLTVQ